MNLVSSDQPRPVAQTRRHADIRIKVDARVAPVVASPSMDLVAVEAEHISCVQIVGLGGRQKRRVVFESDEHPFGLQRQRRHVWVKVHVPLLRTTSRLTVEHDSASERVPVFERAVLPQFFPDLLNEGVRTTQGGLSPPLVRVENRSCSFAHMVVHALPRLVLNGDESLMNNDGHEFEGPQDHDEERNLIQKPARRLLLRDGCGRLATFFKFTLDKWRLLWPSPLLW